MHVTLETRETAAERFNRLLPHHWGARDMALYDVYLSGWPEGAIPLRCWLPVTAVDLITAAAAALELPPGCVIDVRRLSDQAAAAVESVANDEGWRRYG